MTELPAADLKDYRILWTVKLRAKTLPRQYFNRKRELFIKRHKANKQQNVDFESIGFGRFTWEDDQWDTNNDEWNDLHLRRSWH